MDCLSLLKGHLLTFPNNKKSIRNFYEIIKLYMIMVFFNPHDDTNRIKFTCRMLDAPSFFHLLSLHYGRRPQHIVGIRHSDNF